MPVSEGFADTHPNFKFQVERGAPMSQLENSSGESSGWRGLEGGGWRERSRCNTQTREMGDLNDCGHSAGAGTGGQAVG